MEKINVVTLCSGYDAMTLALKRLRHDYPQFDFDLLAWSDIDTNAIKAHKALHPEFADRNIGDLTKYDFDNWDGVLPVDLLIYSTPCQSVSVAGKRKGMKEGDDEASSALIWHTRKFIEYLRPQIMILENVKGIVNKRNLPDFHKWQNALADLGYTHYTKILNAQDYGVAQHRERVFMVSILGNDRIFEFPKPIPLKKRLKDYLEQNVDESYYIADDKLKQITLSERSIEKNDDNVNQVANLIPDREGKFANPHRGRVYSIEGIAPCMHTCGGGNLEPKIMEPVTCASRKRGDNHNLEVGGNIANSLTTINTDSMVIDPETIPLNYYDENGNIRHTQDRIYDCRSISTAITTSFMPYIWELYRVRKITSREAGRLMDVSDEDIDKIENTGISKSAMFKLFGNSIVVSCLYHIFKELFITKSKPQQPTLF